MNDLKVKKDNSQDSEIMVKCEFCGFEYKKCDGLICEGCPINCNIIKCPNCGYEYYPNLNHMTLWKIVLKRLKTII